MSYCVNCGVELESSIKNCPLCNTLVINPRITQSVKVIPPFPSKSGQVEVVKRKDLAVLLSTVLLSTGLTCGLLNLFVLQYNLWSLIVIGICVLIWVLAIPAVIYTKLSLYTSILLDSFAITTFFWAITFVSDSKEWFFQLAIPITILITLLIEVFIFFMRHFRISYLTTALYLFIELALLCLGIEILTDRFIDNKIHLTWSAIVLVVCTIIVVALVTMISKKRFRETIRRKLHF